MGERAQKTRVITWDEYVKHDKPGDMWILIHNKVYDVSKFADNHPGGTMIHLGVKRDATVLFESSHLSLHVREQILPKYEIGTIEEKSQDKLWSWDDPFYDTVKSRVSKHFKDQKKSYHDHPVYYMKLSMLFTAWMLSGYFGFVQGYLLAALMCGYCFVMVGINITHDGLHGAASVSPWLNTITGRMHDLGGISSVIWQHHHNIAHHSHTNFGEYDPDIVAAYPLLRFSPTQKRLFHHQFQHIYVWFLYCFASYRWLLDDVIALMNSEVHKIRIEKVFKNGPLMTLFITSKIGAVITYLLPIYLHGFLHGAAVLICCAAAAGLTASLNFAVSHISANVEVPMKSPKREDWAKAQVIHSTNYSIGNFVACFLSGGLNYQIEHHLFPAISHHYYPEISKIVKDTCVEHNVPYNAHPTYFDALYSHYLHMKNLGTSN
eukprot:TRINITY_DN6971_c0_g2_i1.p1 TRINITY_DN6971_c0_g2~~TRINITY_DN6971_c0_g2_i1.p1  ORF type:complete len:434 (+),score=64.16 TRINITY_DN6971_c0_g2_i1:135-1436(+)